MRKAVASRLDNGRMLTLALRNFKTLLLDSERFGGGLHFPALSPALIAPKRQAAPRFAPEIPLSVAAVPHPKSPASAESAALSKSTDLRLTHPAPSLPLPDLIPLEIQFLIGK